MSIRYVIRTLDRPQDLLDLLKYFERFTPNLGLVVIDGSQEFNQKINKDYISEYKNKLQIEHILIKPNVDIPERTVQGLEAISDKYIFFGADDDFPCIEFVDEANKLIQNRNFSDEDKIFGDQIKLRMRANGFMQFKKFYVPPSKSKDAIARIQKLVKYYQPLVYGVFGRESLIEEYNQSKDVLMISPNNYDIQMGERFLGALAVARGRLHYVPGLAAVRCIKSIRHNTIENIIPYPVLFMPDSNQRAWQAVRHIANAIYGDFDDMNAVDQRQLVVLMNNLFTGGRGLRDMSTNPRWKIGDSILREIFDGKSQLYKQYSERLYYARDAINNAILNEKTSMHEEYNKSVESDPELTPETIQSINASSRQMVLYFDTMTTAMS